MSYYGASRVYNRSAGFSALQRQIKKSYEKISPEKMPELIFSGTGWTKDDNNILKNGRESWQMNILSAASLLMPALRFVKRHHESEMPVLFIKIIQLQEYILKISVVKTAATRVKHAYAHILLNAILHMMTAEIQKIL